MNRAKFYAEIRPFMPGKRLSQLQVHRIEALLNAFAERKLPLNKQAYILGTAHHECDKFRTLTEYASGSAYEGRRDLGNTQRGDGKRFKGRGYVQITGRRNYTDWGNRLGINLVGQPILATDLKYAVPILIDGMLLGTFTGVKLDYHVNGHRTDYIQARRVVNKLDRASLIKTYALKYLKALAAANE